MAGRTAAGYRRPGRLSTGWAGAQGRGGARWGGRRVDGMAGPVHLAHPTAALGEPVAGREAAPTDAASLRGQARPRRDRVALGPVAGPVPRAHRAAPHPLLLG